jgi:hypothetical protein
MSTKTTLVHDFARGGRTVHYWEHKPHPFWGAHLVPLCGLKTVPADSRYIAADDKRCPKCSELARQRIAAASAAA